LKSSEKKELEGSRLLADGEVGITTQPQLPSSTAPQQSFNLFKANRPLRASLMAC